jgi:AcrR family transcriptional regulator
VEQVTEEPGEEQAVPGGNRRALTLAAYARIATDGFEGLRTRDVAADVGVNIGTLHYYFPSKEALIRAAVRHTTAKFAATLSSKGSPAEQLRGHLEGLRHLLKTDQQLWAVSSEVSLRAARDDAIADMMRQADDQWFAFLRGLVARGVDQGCLDGSLQPDGVAAVLIAAIKGLSMPTMGSFRPERIDETIDQLERWLGLEPPTASEPNEV